MARKAAHWAFQLPPKQPQRSTSSQNDLPQPTGGGLRIAAISACLIGGGLPALAQVTPYTEVAGYTVASADGSDVCFAATELTSAMGEVMVYTYYQSQAGQRWHLAGYQNTTILDGPTVRISVSVDGTNALARDTETRDGDFMLPFQALPEIQGFEAMIPEGDALIIGIGEADSLTVPLEDYRAALGAITLCLSTL